MTTSDTQPGREVQIGPLTPAEWLSFFRIDADDNPLPVCCANVSEVRDAIFGVLRAGGDPDICGMHLAGVWHIVDEHLAVPITDESVPAPLRKLYEAYVAPRAGVVDGIDREAAYARIVQVDAATVRMMIAAIGEAWDVDTVEGRIRAATRIGGGFLAYVYDRSERAVLVRELAKAVGMTYEDVAYLVDAMRCHVGLPWQPLEGARG